MANILDKITDVRNAARPNSARVTSGRSAGGATLACDNLSGWPTASKVHFVTYKIDSNSAVVAGTQLDCYGIVSGNNIGSFTVVDGTDTGHAVGDYVEMLPTAAWGQDLADALSVGHTRTGAHAANLPLTTPILSVPVIADHTSATHTHANAAGGGQLTGSTALVNSTVTADKLALSPGTSEVATNESTASTSYVGLTTPQAVTVTVGANGLLLVGYASHMSSGIAQYTAPALSGANTYAATDNDSAVVTTNSSSGRVKLFTGLTAGSTIVTLKFRVDTGTGNFQQRNLWAMPL